MEGKGGLEKVSERSRHSVSANFSLIVYIGGKKTNFAQELNYEEDLL